MLTLRNLLRHASDSLRAPREQARWVMAIEASRVHRWQALVAISLVSTVLSVLLELFKTGDPVFLLGLLAVTPMVGAIATTANSVITVFIVYWVGRAFGGQGGFGAVIAVVAFLQFILSCILAAQLVIAAVIPPLLGVTDVVALVTLFWLFCYFVAELHGFRSALNVFFATMAITAGFVFALYLLTGLLGLAATGVPT